MEVVFVASEMAPFAKTGGLADVIGALPQEIARLGHRVSVFLPFYKKVKRQSFTLESILQNVPVPLGLEIEEADVLSCWHGRVTVFFISHPGFFERDELYGTPTGDYPDNDQRFAFFQRAVIEVLKRTKIKPDVIHCHDWQTGVIPAYLKTIYRGDPFFRNTKTVFTIHNLVYQGNFPPDSLPLTGISWDEFRFQRIEFYGKVSFLKGGIVYSDAITTVSQRYAEEIQTREFGAGMDPVLSFRKSDLHGIVNGIEPDEWDPKKDTDLAANYSVRSLKKKMDCKLTLQKENRLDVNAEVPLFGFVGRLVDQKGIDLIAGAADQMAREGWQLVLLGTGDERYHRLLRDLQQAYPKQIGVSITYDEHMAKRIYAGSDVFLMPSQYEPCGLGQLIALRYGTIPLVRETGGLADTVKEYNPAKGEGNGFVFKGYSARDLLDTMKRAVQVYRDKNVWTTLMKNGMNADFSWAASAQQYVQLYEKIERKTLEG